MKTAYQVIEPLYEVTDKFIGEFNSEEEAIKFIENLTDIGWTREYYIRKIYIKETKGV